MKQFNKKSYLADIYCTETGKYYYVPKTSFKESAQINDIQELERINLDVDPRGGIRVVHLRKNEEVKGSELSLLLPNVKNNFKPVIARKATGLSKEQVYVDMDMHSILNNDYLSLKEYVFASVDGIRFKIKFTNHLKGDNRGRPSDAIYEIKG